MSGTPVGVAQKPNIFCRPQLIQSQGPNCWRPTESRLHQRNFDYRVIRDPTRTHLVRIVSIILRGPIDWKYTYTSRLSAQTLDTLRPFEQLVFNDRGALIRKPYPESIDVVFTDYRVLNISMKIALSPCPVEWQALLLSRQPWVLGSFLRRNIFDFG